MKAELHTRSFIVCPTCGSQCGSIDHLKLGASFGPWRCDKIDCPTEILGKITADGIEIETRQHRHIPHLALLKFRDVYLTVEVSIGGDDGWDYFYHSHQCPQNLLRRVTDVFDAEGRDPHGIMRFVAEVPLSAETQKAAHDADGLQELFALFKTDGQPPETEWPEKNRGVLDFIADAQRDYRKRRSPKA